MKRSKIILANMAIYVGILALLLGSMAVRFESGGPIPLLVAGGAVSAWILIILIGLMLDKKWAYESLITCNITLAFLLVGIRFIAVIVFSFSEGLIDSLVRFIAPDVVLHILLSVILVFLAIKIKKEVIVLSNQTGNTF